MTVPRAGCRDRLNSEVDRSIACFQTSGLRVLARVPESSRATDVALAGPGQLTIIVRCVLDARMSDYRALKTMLAEGDFERAALVYCDAAPCCVTGEIDSWPISRIHELATHLASEPS